MNIKDKIGISTDAGTNVLAILAPVLTYVLSMPEGKVKTGLLALCIVAISVDLYLIKGTKVPPVPTVQSTVEEVLEEGREP